MADVISESFLKKIDGIYIPSDLKESTRNKEISEFCFNKFQELKEKFPNLEFKYSNDYIQIRSYKTDVLDFSPVLTIQYNYDELNNKISDMTQFYYKEDKFSKERSTFVGVINDTKTSSFAKNILEKLPDDYKAIIENEKEFIKSKHTIKVERKPTMVGKNEKAMVR